MAEENNKPMTLEEAINDFKNNFINKRKMICDGQYSKYYGSQMEGAFDEIVQALLSGYIEVKNGNNIVQCIKPTCIEIYYHEEYASKIPSGNEIKGFHSKEFDDLTNEIELSLDSMYNSNKVDENLLIHDYIVYHRNKPFYQETKIFSENAVLNNHQSGIDIAFEFSPSHKINDKEIIVRASALIRGFSHGKDYNETLDKSTVDDRSTYLYDFLYPFASLTRGGLLIEWKDIANTEIQIETKARKNVFRYKMDPSWKEEIRLKTPSQRKKTIDYAIKVEIGRNSSNKPIYESDDRQLSFYNKEFYKNVVQK